MSTLRITDLMIGDYIYQHHPKDSTQHIVKVSIETLDLMYKMEIGLIQERSPLYRLIKPIPLTPEILEKIGFVKEEEARGFSEPYCVYVCEDFQYVIKIYPKGLMDRYSRLCIGEYDDDENVSLLINYLHELQHALKNCGIEKTIEI